MVARAALIYCFLFMWLGVGGSIVNAEPLSGARVLADFEAGFPEGVRPVNAKASLDLTRPASGERSLRLEPLNAERPTAVRLLLPEGTDFSRFESLVAEIAVTGDEPAVRGRWLAADAEGSVIHQRRLAVPADGEWHTVTEPLSAWRWAGDRTGAWSEVRSVTLVIDTPLAALYLDDLRLARSDAAAEDVDPIVRLAFPEDVKIRGQDGLIVATDADVTASDLQVMSDNLRRARTLIRRLFGDSVRPIGEPQKAYLLIFVDDGTRRLFFHRLGRHWDVTVAPAQSAGYTVQSIATAIWDPKQGARRPVFLHESVHAAAAYDVRLLTGHPPHTWLQEGLASYVQICVYPKSLQQDFYAGEFAKPLGDGGQFVPLAELFARRAETRDYAQLASVIAYLAEERIELLRPLARGLADGGSVEQVLHAEGTSIDKFQSDWLTWGQEKFTAEDASRDRHFDLPAEFRP